MFKTSFSVILLLFALFCASIVVRVSQFNSEVMSHEQTYLLTLQTSEIWRHEGFSKCHFTPMWTYGNSGDKHMAYYKRLEDTEGNNFYVSFPPLCFWMAHLVLLPFDVDDGKSVLQLLNLLLHFLSALLIYKIVCLLFKCENNTLFLPALFSFIVYTFLPVSLFLHTNIFFPEMLGQTLWICMIFLILKIKQYGINSFLLYFVLLLLFLYTEWIAVFFTISVLAFYILNKNIVFRKQIMGLSIIALTTAALLMFIQYASIAGVKEMFHAMGLRYLERSGVFGEKYSSMGVHIFSFEGLKTFALNLNKALTIWGYLIILAGVLILIRFKKLVTEFNFIIVLSVIPLLLHWIVFFNANALHLMLMARIAVPLSIMSGIILFVMLKSTMDIITYQNITKTHKANKIKKAMYGVVYVVIATFILHSTYLYNNHFIEKEKYPFLNAIAEKIEAEAAPNQNVFVIMPSDIIEPEKYLTYKSKRNIINIRDEIEALNYIRHIGTANEAVIFIYDKNNIITKKTITSK